MRPPSDEQVKLMAARGFITVKAAADLLGVAEVTIHRYADDGEVEEHWIGHRRYVARKSIEAKLPPPEMKR